MECDVLAVGGMPDHVHLLVAMGPRASTSDLMEAVKGASSRFATDSLLPGRWFQWQRGYGAHSVCPSHRRRVQMYIERQQQHHSGGTVWAAAERCSEESIGGAVQESRGCPSGKVTSG
jgi:REP element-mobilizing transposase RayT